MGRWGQSASRDGKSACHNGKPETMFAIGLARQFAGLGIPIEVFTCTVVMEGCALALEKMINRKVDIHLR